MQIMPEDFPICMYSEKEGLSISVSGVSMQGTGTPGFFKLKNARMKEDPNHEILRARVSSAFLVKSQLTDRPAARFPLSMNNGVLCWIREHNTKHRKITKVRPFCGYCAADSLANVGRHQLYNQA